MNILGDFLFKKTNAELYIDEHRRKGHLTELRIGWKERVLKLSLFLAVFTSLLSLCLGGCGGR